MYRLFDELDTMFWNVYHGVRNIIRWVPVIWRDRDWDHYFLTKVMRQKLLWMAEEAENNGYHVGSKRNAKRMRIAAHLLGRLQDDEYDIKLMEASSGFTIVPFADERNYTLEDLRRILRKAETLRAYDLEYFCRLFAKHVLHWWE